MKKVYKPFFERITILNREQSEKFFQIIASVRSKVDEMSQDEWQEFLDKVEIRVRDVEGDRKIAERIQALFDEHRTYRVKPENVSPVLRDIKYPQKTIDAIVMALDDVGAYVLASTSLTEAVLSEGVETIQFPETEKENTALFNALEKAGFQESDDISVEKFIKAGKKVLLIQVGGVGAIGASGQPDEITVYQSKDGKSFLWSHVDFSLVSKKPITLQKIKNIIKQSA